MSKIKLMLIIGGALTAAALIVGFFPVYAAGVRCGSFLIGNVNFVTITECESAKEVYSLFFFLLFLPGAALLMIAGLDAVKERKQRKVAPPSV